MNRTRFWRARDVPGLSLMHADFRRHDFAPHYHEALVVAATEAGGAEFTARGRTGEARAPTLLVFNPAEAHAGRMGRSRRWRYRGFYLTEPALEAVAGRLGLARVPGFAANEVARPELVAGFLALHRASEAGGDALRGEELLLASFGELFRRHGGATGRQLAAPADRALFARLAALLAERHAEALTLADMGGHAGLSPFQVIGLFKRVAGLTPHAYLTQVRLAGAIHHLKAGLPPSAAAIAAGFYDQSALNRHFKRAYGLTPLQYLRARRG